MPWESPLGWAAMVQGGEFALPHLRPQRHRESHGDPQELGPRRGMAGEPSPAAPGVLSTSWHRARLAPVRGRGSWRKSRSTQGNSPQNLSAFPRTHLCLPALDFGGRSSRSPGRRCSPASSPSCRFSFPSLWLFALFFPLCNLMSFFSHFRSYEHPHVLSPSPIPS